MRASLFHDGFAKHKAAFSERFGAEIVSKVSDPKTEYRLVRDAVGIGDISYMQRFRFPEDKGLDFLDTLCAGNVAKVRFGRMLHTFIADNAGNIVADCYVANNDEEFILLAESIIDDAAFDAMLQEHGAAGAGITDCRATHGLLSIDGYKAWAVVKELFGADVLGLPYLSVERYDFEGESVSLFRAGKTSEFGYYLMVPKTSAVKLFEACLAAAIKNNGGLCGANIHNDLRLEGRFFNVFAEGAAVRDPLALGLQWMIDFSKEKWSGRDAICKRREAGTKNKIIGICTEHGAKELKKGTPIFNGAAKVAEVTASCFSHVLNAHVGLALFPVDIAYAGLQFSLGSEKGPVIKTISMPPIMPKSLSVKLDEL
ncbi:MAG TPA: glycine cleavage T C-terminal barrel domain-containing protein [Chitinivibrionales bacterium]|nr:glycine cleavage T C-terminal barrel domain-containing protein [Chitinivibrionales bacterium]